MEWETVSKEEILCRLENHKAKDFHVDKRIFEKIKECTCIEKSFLDEDDFVSLIWIEINGCRILADGGTRSLKALSEKMWSEGFDFYKLAGNLGYDLEIHDPEWFEKCLDIYHKFDSSSFGLVVLVEANESERNQNPSSDYSIYDGCHRSLVYAYNLRDPLAKLTYEPVECILIRPRP